MGAELGASEGSAKRPPEESVGADETALVAVLEALLFASSEPLSRSELRAAFPGVEDARIDAATATLENALADPSRGIRLEHVAGGIRLVTSPEVAEPLRTLFRFRNRQRLTPATLDVLAIVAYSQPVTSPEIQEIRGTDPSYALRVLLDRKLIRIVGRKRVVGRPMLYGTTREFLLHFGLDTVEDLPPVEAYSTQVLPSQHRLFPTGENGLGEEIDEAEPHQENGEVDANEEARGEVDLSPATSEASSEAPSETDENPIPQERPDAARGDAE